MKKQLNEAKRWQQLAGILNEAVEVPSWLEKKLEDVHTKPGQGSIFAKAIPDVLKIAQDALDKQQDVDQIANGSGTLTLKSPGIGYNLVLPIEKAKQLPDAQEGTTKKVEGPNTIEVPSITTTAPLDQFKTDQLTVIVRPKKDDKGTILPNEYIVLSAFPGDPSIPKASEWNGKYAVIIPGGKVSENWDYGDDEDEEVAEPSKKMYLQLKDLPGPTINEMISLNEIKRMQQLAGILKEDLQSAFWDDIKNGHLYLFGQYVIDIEEDPVNVYVRLAKEPAKPGQKRIDIQTGVLTYNKSSKRWDFSDKGTSKMSTPEDQTVLDQITRAIIKSNKTK
jgi:hypothetical protein